jgi:hypothetical protein
MNKAHFLCLFISLFFISCIDNNDKNLAQTTTKINTISVIIDDQLWDGEIGDTIRNKFAAPVVGLPQEEPLFSINQYPVKFLEGYKTNSRNIIVIKKESKSRFEIKENEFATPQNVFYISGKTAAEIIDTIEKKAASITQIIRQTEIIENQRLIDTSLLKTERILNKFQIALKIPIGYKYVLEKKKFIWLKKEITSGNTSILIYQIPINYIENHPNSSVISNIIKMRDSIGSLYIHGTTANTRMITEEAYAPYFFNTKLDGRNSYETKGTWEMKNDFMSGPFINYCITDYANNRILVLEGFCYASSKEKRDLMFELEAIIKSVKFKKNKK